MNAKILFVEDDIYISKFVKMELNHEGYEVIHFADGIEATEFLENGKVDLAILDIMVPGMDGLSILSEIREFYGMELPVIMLTAKSELNDKVRGLKNGADDYITKPFEIEELIARIEALLRRKGFAEIISYEDLTLDKKSRQVLVDGEPVEFSKTEFDLLMVLLQNKGIVMSKDKLLEKVWGDEEWGNPNVVEVYINYVRKKLKDRGKYIKTVRGSGYVIR